MSDLPSPPTSAAPVANPPANATAEIDPANVVTSVAQSVQAQPDIPAAKAAGVIASVLAGLFQAEPAIFGVTRASAGTQAEVSLGLGLAEIIVGAFLRRSA